MTQYRPYELAVDALTTKLYHEHLQLLTREISQLRVVRAGLKARVRELEAAQDRRTRQVVEATLRKIER